MRKVTAPQIVCMLGDASKVVRAANTFLEQVTRLVRQLVRIGGWIMLLVSLAGILNDPHVLRVVRTQPARAGLTIGAEPGRVTVADRISERLAQHV